MDRNSLNLEEKTKVPCRADDDHPLEVQSLGEALSEAFGRENIAQSHSNIVADRHGVPEAEVKSSVDYLRSRLSASFHIQQPSTSPSQSLTPLQTASPASCFNSAMPSTPKSSSLGSLRLSDSGSHVTAEENAEGYYSSTQIASGQYERSELELVMPSLALPHRRPFTERGKRMGRLTICVAGRKGIFLIVHI
jgi:hypothetical protein